MLDCCATGPDWSPLCHGYGTKLLQFQQTLLSIFGRELRENLKDPETKHGVVVVAAVRIYGIHGVYMVYMAFGNWKGNQ